MIAEEDRFPVGMRVLAVDDDPLCLKVLDSLLRKCNYHVTTTNQAVDALRLLRENRNNYDLVISDVNMPDMDGFKLLELVGLEMDLPVIMLSAYSDKDLVYKGVTHGAVDYLLKPVRIEELKNIWQHVLRRKKLHSNRSSNLDKPREDSIQGPTSTNDQTGKSNRKRKDQNEEKEEGNDVDSNENEESGSQKKPRVVWSFELHKNFVACVNKLGIDKAVPKKILELMNVEGLTRENVASHLQKYRNYLKRLSTGVPQQQDSSYMRMASLDGFGDIHSLSSSGRLENTQGTMLGRLNSPSGLTLRGIASSGLLHPQKAINSFNSLAKIQPTVSPQIHSSNVFQGKSVGPLNYSAATYGAMTLQQNQRRGGFGIQSPLSVPSLNQLPEFQTNWVPLRENVLTGSSHMGTISNDLASSSVVLVPPEDFQGQIGLIDNSMYNSQKHGVGSTNNVDACIFQNGEIESSLSEQTKTQDDNYDSLDDLMNSMIKRQDQNGTILMDGEFEFDGYSLGSCF